MKKFVGIMMLVMLATLAGWHSYDNTNLTEYEEARSLFILLISGEFFLTILVLVITAIKNRKP